MKKLTLLLAPCFVTACATVPELPPPIVTKIEVREVKVPYSVPCLATSDIPTLPRPTQIDLKTADARQVSAALAADLLALDKYVMEADPLLRQCAALVKPTAPKPPAP